jgi:hypothetical protein
VWILSIKNKSSSRGIFFGGGESAPGRSWSSRHPGMGVTSSIEARTKEVLLAQRVLDLKQKKRERDIQQSMQVAATRDRLLWVGGYYTLMGLLAGARHLAGHRRGVKFTWDTFFLPLNQAVVCLPPILFGYQLDYALFNKVCSDRGGELTSLTQVRARPLDAPLTSAGRAHRTGGQTRARRHSASMVRLRLAAHERRRPAVVQRATGAATRAQADLRSAQGAERRRPHRSRACSGASLGELCASARLKRRRVLPRPRPSWRPSATAIVQTAMYSAV